MWKDLINGGPSRLQRAEEKLFAAGASFWRSYYAARGAATLRLTQRKPQECSHVDVTDNMDRTIHMVTCTPAADPTATPLVCLHGYASGTGMFYAALPPLAASWPGPVYVLDSPGCGLSSRKPWAAGMGADCPLEVSEDFWIAGIEGWRRTMGIERMVLCGHSVGGYLSVAYAERHPSRVERLILVSPVGVPHPPPGLEERRRTAPFVFRTAMGMWDKGWGPFPFVRWGPGKWIMDGYVDRRIGQYAEGTSWRDVPLIAKYFHANLTHGNASWGGCAHSTLLLAGAFARSPLCERIPKLELGSSLSFIYGADGDWMDFRHAEALKGRGAATIEVAHIASAGHNLLVDNPLGFALAVAASGGGRFDGVVFGEGLVEADREECEQRAAAAAVEGRRLT